MIKMTENNVLHRLSYQLTGFLIKTFKRILLIDISDDKVTVNVRGLTIKANKSDLEEQRKVRKEEALKYKEENSKKKEKSR